MRCIYQVAFIICKLSYFLIAHSPGPQAVNVAASAQAHDRASSVVSVARDEDRRDSSVRYLEGASDGRRERHDSSEYCSARSTHGEKPRRSAQTRTQEMVLPNSQGPDTVMKRHSPNPCAPSRRGCRRQVEKSGGHGYLGCTLLTYRRWHVC